MRLILIVLLLSVVVAGALFGALNGAPVGVDFYFFRCELPLGGALLGALVLGWLLGGLVACVPKGSFGFSILIGTSNNGVKP